LVRGLAHTQQLRVKAIIVQIIKSIDEGNRAGIGAPLQNRFLEGLGYKAITLVAGRNRIANALQTIGVERGTEIGFCIVTNREAPLTTTCFCKEQTGIGLLLGGGKCGVGYLGKYHQERNK
jgi:hypothetical protein